MNKKTFYWDDLKDVVDHLLENPTNFLDFQRNVEDATRIVAWRFMDDEEAINELYVKRDMVCTAMAELNNMLYEMRQMVHHAIEAD